MAEIPADCPLTQGEWEVAQAVAKGHTKQQIADDRGKTYATIRTQIFNACEKLGAHSMSELLIAMSNHGWTNIETGMLERVTALRERLRLEQVDHDHAEAKLALITVELAAMTSERDVLADRVTPAQSLYLDAFVRWLHAPDDEDLADERAFMLKAMYHERSWESVANGGEAVLPPWEVLGRPQPAGWRSGQRRPGLKVFPVTIGT